MNYRHAFHAGGFADVFKHVLVVRILLYLLRKDASVCYIDTHAGAGAYDLAGPDAGRTGEWRGGIGRLEQRDGRGDANSLIAPYLDLVGPRDAESRPMTYPGSPVIAQRLLRSGDRLILNELHPHEASALRAAIGRDPRARITEFDGYLALNAFVPPRPRRGLVVIDPAFERGDEFTLAATALGRAHGKWPTGVYALWYPLKDPRAADGLVEFLVAIGLGRALRLELLVEQEPRLGAHERLGLIGCGLIVVNPPFTLEAEAKVILPDLALRLARRRDGACSVAWLAAR